jgi:pyruvate ferredoxin oxidoreductase alpha subunit
MSHATTGRVGIEVSIAIAEAIRQARAECIAAYPITPQTHIVEHLSEIVNDGDLDAEFVTVESEHSAMSACCGMSAVGARTYTATAAQGLILMQEILPIASALRLPIMMTVVSRTVSGPLGIWNDHSDIMGCRDVGWIVIFTENGQDAYDQHFCAFKIAEDRDVLLPTIVDLDGFILSHVVEAVEFVDQAVIDAFLPDYKPLHTLNPDQPASMGTFAVPEIYSEAKMAHDMALRNARKVIERVWDEWGKATGRYYKALETYRTDDADTVFLSMGSFGETISMAVDRLRDQGQKVGLVKLRLWRPFPDEDIRQLLTRFKRVIVVDRALSFGGVGGPFATEVRAALYGAAQAPVLSDFVVGLGGRDVTVSDFVAVAAKAAAEMAAGRPADFHFYGVRG